VDRGDLVDTIHSPVTFGQVVSMGNEEAFLAKELFD
jgi:hypothetical protein